MRDKFRTDPEINREWVAKQEEYRTAFFLHDATCKIYEGILHERPSSLDGRINRQLYLPAFGHLSGTGKPLRGRGYTTPGVNLTYHNHGFIEVPAGFTPSDELQKLKQRKDAATAEIARLKTYVNECKAVIRKKAAEEAALS